VRVIRCAPVDAALIRLDQHLGAGTRLLVRHAHGQEAVHHEGLEVLERDALGPLDGLVLVRPLLALIRRPHVKEALADLDNHILAVASSGQERLHDTCVLSLAGGHIAAGLGDHRTRLHAQSLQVSHLVSLVEQLRAEILFVSQSIDRDPPR
jgi:hypothetical protein